MIMYNKTPTKQYRIAFLIIDDATKQSFRYHRLSRKDINSVQLLQNLNIDEYSITIETTANLDFGTTKNKIISLDNREFRIQSIYEEEMEGYDGYISNLKRTKKYLILRGI